MKYKVFFYAGSELTIKTKVSRGVASLDTDALRIQSDTESVLIPLSAILSAHLFKLHGVGSVIRLEHNDGRLFVSVIRFLIWQFALINMYATRELHQKLSAVSKNAIGPE